MVPYLRAANVKDGVLDLTDVKSMNFDPREQQVFALEPGDVLVTEGSGSLSSVGASAVWRGEITGSVCFQNTLLRLRPREGTDARFLAWWSRYAFGAGLFASVATGANIFHVSAERVRAMRAPVHSLQEQRRIADYLDVEVTRVDELISVKQEMLIAVDERLRSDIGARLAEVKPCMPLKRSWRVIDCKHRTPTYRDSGYPVMSPGDITAGRIDITRAHRFVDRTDYHDLADAAHRPKRGDIIYSRNASIGIASYVDTDQQFCMGQDVCLITSHAENQLYLMYVLNTVGLEQLERQKIGSTFNRVNVSQILELEIPTPSRDLQDRLAHEFDRRASDTLELTRTLGEQIDLLQERRRSLITAVVTGEMEVP